MGHNKVTESDYIMLIQKDNNNWTRRNEEM